MAAEALEVVAIRFTSDNVLLLTWFVQLAELEGRNVLRELVVVCL